MGCLFSTSDTLLLLTLLGTIIGMFNAAYTYILNLAKRQIRWCFQNINW